jgi:hypothetical protein
MHLLRMKICIFQRESQPNSCARLKQYGSVTNMLTLYAHSTVGGLVVSLLTLAYNDLGPGLKGIIEEVDKGTTTCLLFNSSRAYVTQEDICRAARCYPCIHGAWLVDVFFLLHCLQTRL